MAQNRTKGAVSAVKLAEVGRGDAEHTAFDNLINEVANQPLLSHRDSKKPLCVFTDASDTIQSAIITQIQLVELRISHMNQPHELMCFLIRSFQSKEASMIYFGKESVPYSCNNTLNTLDCYLNTWLRPLRRSE